MHVSRAERCSFSASLRHERTSNVRFIKLIRTPRCQITFPAMENSTFLPNCFFRSLNSGSAVHFFVSRDILYSDNDRIFSSSHLSFTRSQKQADRKTRLIKSPVESASCEKRDRSVRIRQERVKGKRRDCTIQCIHFGVWVYCRA